MFKLINCVLRYNHVSFCLKTILIYSLLFLCLWPFLSRVLRFSKLYQNDINKSVDYVTKINSDRITQAEVLLNTLNPYETRQVYLKNRAKPHLRFAIGVVTISRSSRMRHDSYEPLYLTQVMSRLHQVLVENNALDDVFLFICNVDAHPEQHVEASHLSKFFPNITRIYDARRSLFHDSDARRRSRYYSERQDYAYCLQSSLDVNSKYVILLQDDAYPHLDFYPILHTTLRTKLETRIRGGELVDDPKDWAWLKLMSPYYRNDFHRNNFVISLWIAITCFASGFITLAYYFHRLRSRQTPDTNRHLVISCYILFVLSFVFFLPTVLTIGRPYYLKLRSLSQFFYYLEPGVSCCIPAVLYPSDKLPGLIEFLKGSQELGLPMDFAMGVYRQEQTNLKQYLLTPNIFTHIGLHSTLNGFKKERSFAYEYFND